MGVIPAFVVAVSPPPARHGSAQNHLWKLFARHTTIMLVILYLVYTEVSTVVSRRCSCRL